MPGLGTLTILITGATGNIGRELTKELSAQRVPFRAMVRSNKAGEAVAALESAEVFIGDFNDSKSIANALEGVDRAFLLTNSSELAEVQQVTFVDVAKRAGVKHIVKLSQWAADLGSPLTGPEGLTHGEMAEKLSNALDREIQYVDIPPEAMMDALLGI